MKPTSFPHGYTVRKASIKDVSSLYDLISPFIERNILLSVTKDKLLENIDQIWVCDIKDEIVGTATLINYGNDLYEVRAFAVSEKYQNQGIGQAIINELENELKQKERSIRLFALTYLPGFFIKRGWDIVSKENYPQKIYEVCRLCNRAENCQEIAVEIKFG